VQTLPGSHHSRGPRTVLLAFSADESPAMLVASGAPPTVPVFNPFPSRIS